MDVKYSIPNLISKWTFSYSAGNGGVVACSPKTLPPYLDDFIFKDLSHTLATCCPKERDLVLFQPSEYGNIEITKTIKANDICVFEGEFVDTGEKAQLIFLIRERKFYLVE